MDRPNEEGGAPRTSKVKAKATLGRALHVSFQWLLWAVLLLVALLLLSGGLLSAREPNASIRLFWAGCAALAVLVVPHFPPLFFRAGRRWRRWSYIAVLPALVVGLVCFVMAAPDRPPAIDTAEVPATSEVSSADPTSDELKTICAKMQNMSTGQPIETITVDVVGPALATLSYVRDDGKGFRYDCRVTGDRVEHRMHDEGGPGVLGQWRERLWHSWSRENGEVVVVEHFE